MNQGGFIISSWSMKNFRKISPCGPPPDPDSNKLQKHEAWREIGTATETAVHFFGVIMALRLWVFFFKSLAFSDKY